MTRWLPGLIAVALLPLASCAQEASSAGDPLLLISGPEAFERIELRDMDREVIWSLVADVPAPLARLFYGEVPSGFRQEAPADGSTPRQLIPGEPLTVESRTPLRVFRHEGFVADDQRFSIEHWEMKLRNPPAPPVPEGAPQQEATVDATPRQS